jgi:hypothetical protein
MKSDTILENDDGICFCDECWLQGDEQAFLKVEALMLPRRIEIFEKNFSGLGERITEQAEGMLEYLRDKYGEKTPFIVGLALRRSYYAEYRITKKINGSPLADRYSPYTEDKISEKFRAGTPLAVSISEQELLNSLGVFQLSVAADLQAEGKTASAFDAIFQAQFLMGLSMIYCAVETQMETVETNKKLSLSEAGAKGAESRMAPYKAMSNWVMAKASGMRGDHKTIARTLAAQLPKHLAEVSKDPARHIYETLRKPTKSN